LLFAASFTDLFCHRSSGEKEKRDKNKKNVEAIAPSDDQVMDEETVADVPAPAAVAVPIEEPDLNLDISEGLAALTRVSLPRDDEEEEEDDDE
jgi:hypothetical protein